MFCFSLSLMAQAAGDSIATLYTSDEKKIAAAEAAFMAALRMSLLA